MENGITQKTTYYYSRDLKKTRKTEDEARNEKDISFYSENDKIILWAIY